MAKLRYISLFSGIEAWSCAVKDMPEYEPVAFCEIDPFASAVLKHHYPNTPNLGDITKVDWSKYNGEVDLVVGGSPCFVAGTPVLTPSGYRSIEEIAVGDEVVSADGNVCQVEAAGHQNAPVGLLKILGRPAIVCTPTHPFLCISMKRDDRRKSPTYAQKIPSSEPWFVPAEKAVGMYACRGRWKQAKLSNIPDIGLSAGDIIELAGWYVGDGYIRRWKGKNKKAVVFALVNERKIQLFKDKFFYAVGAISKDGKVSICSTSLAEWLVENFGEHSYAKRIPYWLYTHPLRERFVAGYFATDGQDRGTHMRFTTTSQALAYGVADLGRGNVSFDKRPPKCVIEGREVNQRDTYTALLYTTYTPRTKWFYERWTSVVRSWTPLDEQQTVYNLTVSKDHTYVASGFAVHNCQGFSIAGLRKGLQDDRSCLALAYVKAIEAIKPRWFVFENVPAILSCNNGNDIKQFFAALNDCGYSISWAVLDSQYFSLAQRRRRLFACGYLGGWERPAKVFFEPDCLQRHPPARRPAGQNSAGSSAQSSGDGGLQQPNAVCGTLCASGAGLDRPSANGNQESFLVVEREQELCRRIPQPLQTVGTLVASGACTERVARDGQDFLILDRQCAELSPQNGQKAPVDMRGTNVKT